MSILKPEITVTLFPRKKKVAASEPTPEPTVDYAAVAEEAAQRLGKKLVLGTVVVTISTVAAVTLGNIVLEVVKHNLNK